jgi:hypothetical protein
VALPGRSRVSSRGRRARGVRPLGADAGRRLVLPAREPEREKPLAFFGNDYADRPSTWNTTNDATYAYDALYN